MMKTEEFDYRLPEELIAQEPAARRDASRLLVLDRADGSLRESTFARLGDFLRPRDLLVLNDTRVLPARLLGFKPTGGRVEILLLDREPEWEGGGGGWRCMVSTGKGLGPGARLAVGPGMDVEVLGEEGGAVLRVRLHHALGDDASALERHGRMPLPPYIRRAPDDPRAPADRERYQTVYARQEGAVAAPTAGLHFTEALLGALRNAGVGEARLTLHVGPGTFRPVRAERIEDHAVDPERFRLPEATAAACGACRSAGGRVVAVGTTVARVLESRARPDGSVEAGEGWCDLYIRPGHPFRAVDALVTNLHLPRSSLLILVSAFAGRERVLAAYREAIARRYRFFSYGDAMVIL